MWKYRLFIKLFRWLFCRSPAMFEQRIPKLQAYLAEEANVSGPFWMSSTTRPKRPYPAASFQAAPARIGVVLQGPLATKDDFTLETVRYYRQALPESLVVVSTWEDENARLIAALKQCGARVVLSVRPTYDGPHNVNRQIVSTQAGLDAVREAGFEFALKTRCDTRLYASRFASFLMNLLATFPTRAPSLQRHRLAILDQYTRLLIPFHPSDIMMFGHVDDLTAFWSTPLSQEPAQTAPPTRHIDLWQRNIPEVYLGQNYLQSIGYPFEITIASWWQALADLFVVVDRQSVDHFWPKGCYTREFEVDHDAHLRTMAICSFREWLNIYHGETQITFSETRLRELGIDRRVAG